MQIIQGAAVRTVKLHNISVALGTFDAMHGGHSSVICAAAEYAAAHGLTSAAYLFRVPPKAVFDNEIKCVNSLDKRLKILEQLGMEIAIVEEFDKEYANTSCEDFIEYVQENLGAKAVYAGFNYHFGKGGSGDAERLKQLCAANAIHCEIVPCFSSGGTVSSSIIRSMIESGRIEQANSLLHCPYSVSGQVVHGNELGRRIGFPTANMDIPEGLVIPMDGVYAGRVSICGTTYPAIANVGGKPTVSRQGRNIETHIIGFDGKLYGQEIEVEFLKYLRGIVKFSSVDELKSRLELDKKDALLLQI